MGKPILHNYTGSTVDHIKNMTPIDDGDRYFIRKEYAEVKNLAEAQGISGGEGNATKGEGEGIQGGSPAAAAAGSGRYGMGTAWHILEP